MCLERLGVSLVGEYDLSAERAVRDDLDRGHAAVVSTHVAHGVLASFVAQELDLAGEVPLQRVGDRALSRAVVSVDGEALTLAEIHGHLARDSAKGVHHETLDLFSHRRTSSKSRRIASDRSSSVFLQDLRKASGEIRRQILQRFEDFQKELLCARPVH